MFILFFIVTVMCENEVLNADTQIQNWMYVYFILTLLLITYMGVNDPLNRKLGMSCSNLFIL